MLASPRTNLFTEVENLKIEIQNLHHQILREKELNKYYSEEISYLTEMVREFKRHRFGKKSEKWESEEQLKFNEAEEQSLKPDLTPDDVDEEKTTVKGHLKKKRGHRKALPENMEREEVIIELPESERVSKEGYALKVIGYEISEKLSYEPAKTKVIVYKRAKYGLDSGDYEKTAPPIPSIIPQGIATPELIASVIVEKYAYGTPLYRQEYKFTQMGVELTRQTMARWVVKSAQALVPVWNILNDRLLSSFYISCDETPTQVLKEKNKSAESKSWMWVRTTPYGPNKIVLFDYDPHRSSEVAKKQMEGFSGYLQVDGLASYNVLENNLTRIGCNMHGRRYFESASSIGAKSGQSLAERGLSYYQQLYEHEAKIRSLSHEEKNRLRQEVQKPIWDEFKAWAEANTNKVPPKSKIGKAFNYFLSEYDYLIGYLRDGRLEMDNGFAERMIRQFAIGRNNWLFADTPAGAEASSLFYSLLCTAKINDLNIYETTKYLLTEIPKANSLEDIERLADIVMGIIPIKLQ